MTTPFTRLLSALLLLSFSALQSSATTLHDISAKRETAAASAPADSTTGPISHRSPLETALYMPGYIVYFPFHIFLSASKFAASAVWEYHALDRIKARLTTADGRLGIRPLSSTAIGSGVHLFARDLADSSHIALSSSWGAEEGRRHHALSIAWPHRTFSGARAHFYARFGREPKESFYGIGNATRASSKSAFNHEHAELGLHLNRTYGTALRWNSGLIYKRTTTGPGISGSARSVDIVYPNGNLVGWGKSADFAQVHIDARAQFVDIPGSPTRGHRVRTHLSYSHSLDGLKFSHWALRLSSEHFFELFYRRTLSVQFAADWRWAPGAPKIPFYDLASLGGSEILRGYRRGRFRDRGVSFAALHYTYPVWKRIDGHLFGEAGRTLAQPRDFSLKNWHQSCGFGLRLWVPQGLIFEQSIAFGAETTKLYFNFKADF